MAGLLGIGITGLQAAQLGLSTASHNIVNAATPGYSRQEVVQATLPPQATGNGFIGQGTAVETIRRQFDEFLNREVVIGESQSAALAAFHAQITRVDDLLADPNAGLAPALQSFFNGLHDVANEPGSVVARSALVSAGEGLVSRFRLIDQRLSELRASVNGEIVSTVAGINTFAAEIARLNERIVVAESAVEQPANDLRDRRDQLVLELNRLVGASVTQQGGAYNVFVGNGVPVVIGAQSFALGTLASPTDPGRTVVGIVTPGGVTQIPDDSLQGGSLGGVIAFRGQSLDSTQNALGRIAIVLAGTVNEQHALGQDLAGALGGAFFGVAPASVAGSNGNTGNAQLAAAFTDYGALTTSDYRILYDGAAWTVTRLSDGAQQSFAALPATVDGVAISIASGAANANDQFLLRPTALGASGIAMAISDPARVAAAAPIRTAAGAANTGAATISAGAVNAPPPPDANLTQTVTITFTGPGTFNVTGVGTGNPAGVAYTPGAGITYNGWTMAIAGTPAAGDTFTVSANTGGVSDSRNALLLAALQSRGTIAGGTATFQSAYGQLVSRVGDDTRGAGIRADAQQAFLAQAQAARESYSGVNLDEEAANLVRYQQAYQAAARAIQVGSRLFDELLDLSR
ncbi:MAG: flagellar hook-associated protein FlgK [Burkholderiales bacterium]|nr:flagellar hook-associated protein FlgK [Burkholderiales bacterium]